MMVMTPAEARRELKELGFTNVRVHPNGATTWVMTTLTVFIPARSLVAISMIESARYHALKLSLAGLPVTETT